jgi:oxidoreductase
MGAAEVRVAVVGLGWAARSIWLPRLLANPAYRVTAVVDPDPAARAKVAGRGDLGAVLGDVAELGPDLVDLAVVAVPNHLHARIAAGLLARGVSVFLEKPVCLNADEARLLAEAESAGGAVLLAGSAARYRADVGALYELSASLGQIRHVEISWVRASGIPDAGGWFTRRDLSGGGALVDLGWHLLDTVSPLLGSSGFRQVVGAVSADFVAGGAGHADWRHGDRRPAGIGDVEDTARAFLVTDDGVSVAIRASWASHEAIDVTTIRVDGADGTATVRCTFGFSPNRVDRAVLTRATGGQTTEVEVPAEPVGAEYDRQLADLPGLLADPASRGRAIDDAARTIGVIDRVYRSAWSVHPIPAVPARV